MATIFPKQVTSLGELIRALEQIHAAGGDMPLVHRVDAGVVGRVTVSVGAVGAGKGSLKLVSRGGKPALLLS